MKYSRPLLECAMKLRNLDEFRPLRDFLASEASKHDLFLRNTNQDRPLAVAQGMSRAIHDLIDFIDSAPAELEKERPQSRI